MAEKKNKSPVKAITPQNLKQLDPAAAERAFNTLSLDKKIQVVLAAPWNMRRNIIMLSENALELVQSLPCEELYWTVRQAGIEESLQLISLSSHEQLQYLMDVDCWRKDALDQQSIFQWYKILSKCSDSKVIEWFQRADEQFLTASFHKLVKVLKIQQDTDISEEYESMPAATLDGIYYFIFLEKDAYSTVMPLLNNLYLNDRDYFYTLVEGMIWDTGPEMEEAAYEWKERRLAEYGFPEFEESLNVYQIMPDAELDALAVSGGHEPGTGTPIKALTRYELTDGDMPGFYVTALGMLEESEAFERVQRETIVLANKVLVADALEVQSPEDTARALKKAAGAIGIGLEFLSGSTPAAAASLLASYPAETLFRAGISLIMKVKKEYLAFGWHVHGPFRESFFGTPGGEALRGITQSRPVFYEGCTVPGSVAYRAFASLQELQFTREVVGGCREIDCLLFTTLAIDPGWLFSDFIAATTLVDPAELTAAAVLMTMAARLILGGEARLTPLTESELVEFLTKTFPGQSRAEPAPPVLDAVFEWLDALRAPAYLRRYYRDLLAGLGESVCGPTGQKTIEKRYIDKLLFKGA